MVPREGRNIEFFTPTLTAADTASSATNYKAHYHADLRIYIEACHISNIRMRIAWYLVAYCLRVSAMSLGHRGLQIP